MSARSSTPSVLWPARLADRQLARVLERPVARHAVGLGVLVLAAVWLMRRFLFTSALPAGTDMLGFVTRSRENASLDEAFSVWAPSIYGTRRQVTLENVLGLLTIATRDPVTTVKLASLLTLVAAGAFTYLLAWKWFGSVFAASVAGLLYMTSQASVSRWASGQLNVEMALAAAPLLVYLWASCVERYTLRRAIVFAIAASAVMLVRLDMVLYVAPFLALLVVLRLVLAQRPRGVLANTLKSVAVIVPACIGLVLYQIVPLAGGIRATWVSGGQLFDVQELVDRSLGAYDSLLGLGRELGYLGFTGQQTWYYHPWVPQGVYWASASVIVVLAYAAVVRNRHSRVLYLTACAILATFLGKGIRDPLGGVYLWGLEHVPVFGNLRGPNRWLIVQTLAYAVLAGLTLQAVLTTERIRREGARVVAVVALLAVMLLPVGPTLVSGFRTWEPSPQQLALLDRLERTPGEFRVATVPFDQTSRFVEQGSYRGFEHDLGAESAGFTGHPTLADGGWHQRAADFVAYSSELLRRGDPAFTQLLGSANVGYLLELGYPATAPHLLTAAQRLNRSDLSSGSFLQHRNVARMPGLVPVAHNGGGTVYRVASGAPLVSFRPNVAVVLGGRSGLSALAALPGVHLENWAVVTATDALAAGGLDRLLELVRTSSLVVVSNERIADVALTAAPAVAVAPAITSDPGLDRQTQLLPSDASTRLGALASEDVAAPQAETYVSRARFTVAADAPPLELWARVESSATAGRVTFRVDGRRVARVTPVAPTAGAFRWVRLATLPLRPGSHTLAVSGAPSRFGNTFEVDETRLVDPAARAQAESRLERAVSAAGARVVYSLDVADAVKWADLPPASAAERVGGAPASFWRALEPARVGVSASAGAATVVLRPGREFYTVLQHTFGRPLDWRDRAYLFVSYAGTGSGARYRFFVDFDRRHVHSAQYTLVDDVPGPRTVALSTLAPQTGKPPFTWGRVLSVRVATDSRDALGTLRLGPLAVSPLSHALALSYPLAPAATALRADVAGDRADLAAGARELRAQISYGDLARGGRIVVRAPGEIRELPTRPVRWERRSPTSYRWAVDARTPGMLVFAQGFDVKWEAKVGLRRLSPVPVQSVLNGYPLPRGSTAGALEFRGRNLALLGAGAAGFVLSLLVFLVYSSYRPWRGVKA